MLYPIELRGHGFDQDILARPDALPAIFARAIEIE
jgi:hypothetical protein